MGVVIGQGRRNFSPRAKLFPPPPSVHLFLTPCPPNPAPPLAQKPGFKAAPRDRLIAPRADFARAIATNPASAVAVPPPRPPT